MQFKFFIKKKKKILEVKPCNSVISKLTGLMFRTKSRPLLFVFDKEKTISIHSLFCRPFVAIWLDKNKKTTKIAEVKPWKINISGRGMYLLEVLENDGSYYKMMKTTKSPTRKGLNSFYA